MGQRNLEPPTIRAGRRQRPGVHVLRDEHDRGFSFHGIAFHDAADAEQIAHDAADGMLVFVDAVDGLDGNGGRKAGARGRQNRSIVHLDRRVHQPNGRRPSRLDAGEVQARANQSPRRAPREHLLFMVTLDSTRIRAQAERRRGTSPLRHEDARREDRPRPCVSDRVDHEYTGDAERDGAQARP